MTETAVLDPNPALDLRARLEQLRSEEPGIRARDAAERLDVSEAEIVACRVGNGVRRLSGRWGEMLESLPSLGEVMVLTRNNSVVHEKTGRFGQVTVTGKMGLVLNREIDLRVLLHRWSSGFAVTEEVSSGVRHSLQFFGPDGEAIHKIYVQKDVETAPYEDLVKRFLDPDQSPGEEVKESSPPAPERSDADIDVEGLRGAWAALQDVHDFIKLLHKYKVGRVQALRLVGSEFVDRVEPGSFVAALEEAARTGLSIMIFVGNPGMIQIHTGPVSKLRRVGPWFNVLDEGFNLHLLDGHIASAWVVRKPTVDGIVTSLEVYDSDNRQIATMFGERHEGEPENPAWRTLLADLERVR